LKIRRIIMHQRQGGVFNGTGADVYICVGFVPDWIKLWNTATNTPCSIEWNRGMMSDVLCNEGVYVDNAGGAVQDLASGEGVTPYYGGATLTSTTAGTTTYGEGVYLQADDRDYRYYNDDQRSWGDAENTDINKWTLDSGYQGHFNDDVVGTYIGEGSPICIDGRWYTITVLAGAAGSGASAVTLSHTGVSSGEVQYIGGKYGYRPMVASDITKDGFRISNTTVNENNMLVAFECGTWGST